MPVSSTGRKCLSHFPRRPGDRHPSPRLRVAAVPIRTKTTLRLVTTAYRLSLASQSRTIAAEVLMNNAGGIESGLAQR